MLKQAINSFVEGLNKDLDKSILSNKAYISSKNFRLVTEKGLSGGAKENMLGNTYVGSVINTDLYIVGYTWVRDTLVLFTTDNTSESPTAGDSRIYTLTFKNKLADTLTEIYADGDGKGYLKFSTKNKVQAVGRYETSTTQKVYFVDSFNNSRYCNIARSSLSTQSVALFEMVPDFSLSKPSYVNMVTGELPVGKIQYTYQLYTNKGTETIFAPASNLIPLTPSSYTSALSNTHIGGSKGENSGKGVKGRIVIGTTGFNRVRVVAIHYDTFGGIPTLRLVTEKTINTTDTSIEFVDNGDSLGEYTLEEFSVISRIVFSGTDIENKGDHLFISNTTEDNFDVDFDARAYRFNSAQYCRLYESDDSYYVIDGSTVNKSWIYYDSGGTSLDSDSDWKKIPNTADCINAFNNLDNDSDSSYRWKYKTNGITLGAEGPYVSINIGVTGFDLDSDVVYNNRVSGVPIYPIEGYKYNNYTGPYLASSKISYQRDEVYRFGIVFFDSKGRESFVKWINDFRMPSRFDGSAYELTSKVSNKLRGILLRTVFIVDTTGTDAEGLDWMIVRVARSTGDRSVLAQGMMSHTNYATSYDPDQYRNPVAPGWVQPSTHAEYTRTTDVCTLISPEISINKNLIPVSSDFIEVKGKYTCEASWRWSYDFSPGGAVESSIPGFLSLSDSSAAVTKYSGITELASVTERHSISQGSLAEYSVSGQDPIDVGETYSFYNWCNENEGESEWYGPSSTKLVFSLDTVPADGILSLAEYEPLYVNYRRNVFETQYGGNTYEDKLNNEYISCSNVSSSTSVNSLLGDTYITVFDYLYCMWNEIVDGDDTYESSTGNKLFSNILFPVETSINTDLRSDKSYTVIPDNSSAVLLREVAGIYEGFNSSYFQQDYNLYDYNSVYSQENDSKKYYPKQLDFESSETFDTRVVASDRKINGEQSDSWTIFRANNFIDVDSKYGSITNILEYRDSLYFFQPDRAFGTLSVNERSLIQDNNTSALVLGEGGILDRYDYISTEAGNSNLRGVITSNSGLYWVDNLTREVFFFNGTEQKLSKVKGIQSDFRILDAINNVIGVYDKEYNEIVMTVEPIIYSTLDSESGMGGVEWTLTLEDTSDLTAGDTVSIDGDSFTIDTVTDETTIEVTVNSTAVSNYAEGETVNLIIPERRTTYLFSDLSQTYIDTPSFKPSMYIDANEYYMTSTDDQYLYTHNLGSYGIYYGNSAVNSELSFIVNVEYPLSKTFASLGFDTSCKDSDDNEIYGTTFTSIRCSNDFQNTDWITIDTERYSNDRNCVNREGHWSFQIPRNAVNASREDNVDIFDSSNIDYSAREYRERLRDKHMRVDLKFDNSNNYKFSFPYILTNYQISTR